MRVINNTTRDGWLETRRTHGIGASDAPIILGLSKYKSPFQLYHEKLGLDMGFEESVQQKIGLLAEPVITQLFVEETGRRVIAPPPFTIYQSDERDWLLASLDRIQELPETGDTGPLELKNAHWNLHGNWESEPPLEYVVQVQHQLAVCGSKMGSIAAIVGGSSFLWCDIRRDDEFIAALLAEEEKFWTRCQERNPPPIDSSEETRATLKKLYARETGEIIALPVEAIEWDGDLVATKEAIKRLTEKKTGLENLLLNAIGNATVGQISNGTVYTYKTVKKASYTVKATEFRQLRRKGE